MTKKKDPLAELKRIDRDMKELGRKIREEERTCQAELVDRLRLRLSGEDAIKHHNDWMMLHDLPHLVIE